MTDADDVFAVFILLFYFILLPIIIILDVVLLPFALIAYLSLKSWFFPGSLKDSQFVSFEYYEPDSHFFYYFPFGRKFIVLSLRFLSWSLIGIGVILGVAFLAIVLNIEQAYTPVLASSRYWIFFFLIWPLSMIVPLGIGFITKKRKETKERRKKIRIEEFRSRRTKAHDDLIAQGPVISNKNLEEILTRYNSTLVGFDDRYQLFYHGINGDYSIEKGYLNELTKKYHIVMRNVICRSLIETFGHQWTKDQWQIFLHQAVPIQSAVGALIKFNLENDRLPDREELFLLDIPVELLVYAIDLFNLPVSKYLDFNHLTATDLISLEKYFKKALKKQSHHDWKIENLVVSAKIPLFIAKVLPTFINYVISSDLSAIKDIYENAIGIDSSILETWDIIALRIVKYKYKHGDTISLLDLARTIQMGLIETRLILDYTENLLLNPLELPPSSDPKYHQIENNAKKIGLAKKNKKIVSGVDIRENLLKLSWSNLSEVLLATQYYSQVVLDQPLAIDRELAVLQEVQLKTSSKIFFKITRTEKLNVILSDLLKGNAIPFKQFTKEFQWGSLDIPREIRKAIGKSIEEHSIVTRAGLILLVNCPPTDVDCQICSSTLEGKFYFQCKGCQRFLCISHYVDIMAVGTKACPTCGNNFVSFPFTCDGCSLDFATVGDLGGKSDVCNLCGYNLPEQDELIQERIQNISPSVQKIQISNDKKNR